MDEKYHKVCLYIVSSRLKLHLNLINISQKATIKIVIKDVFLKLMFFSWGSFPEKQQDLHNDLPFTSERLKIENLTNLHDKKQYVMHIKSRIAIEKSAETC